MKKLKPVIWTSHGTFYPPPDGEKLRTSMRVWLNQTHAGTDHAAEEVSREHMDSHYEMSRARNVDLTLVLQKDGSSIPIELKMGGRTYTVQPKS